MVLREIIWPLQSPPTLWPGWGGFLGWENPKSPEFAAPKKTTKKQDRRNMGSNRMKHGIQQMKKQFLGPMLVLQRVYSIVPS